MSSSPLKLSLSICRVHAGETTDSYLGSYDQLIALTLSYGTCFSVTPNVSHSRCSYS